LLSILTPENGLKILDLFLVPIGGYPTLSAGIDPNVASRRIEPPPSGHGTYVMMIAEKTDGRTPFLKWPQQSDYKSAWGKASENCLCTKRANRDV
jgi:hypothetical protein